jgi:hypothetical protein
VRRPRSYFQSQKPKREKEFAHPFLYVNEIENWAPAGTPETVMPELHGHLSGMTLPALSAENGAENISLLTPAAAVVVQSLSVRFPDEPGATMETLTRMPAVALSTPAAATL